MSERTFQANVICSQGGELHGQAIHLADARQSNLLQLCQLPLQILSLFQSALPAVAAWTEDVLKGNANGTESHGNQCEIAEVANEKDNRACVKSLVFMILVG